MKTLLLLLVLLVGVLFAVRLSAQAETHEIDSPDESMRVTFFLRNGAPFYRIKRQGSTIIKKSKLGFRFKDAPSLNRNFRIVETEKRTFDDTWEQPWGEVRHIRNHYNELSVLLEEIRQPKRQLRIIFRVFDDGVGFRYELPEQANLREFQIMDEETEFVFTGDHAAWWIPAYRDNRYEYLFQRSPISKLDTVHTPLTLETSDGLYLSVHEAALTDYASMTLEHTRGHTLKCNLIPWSDGVRVYGAAPFVTPWRTIQIADTPGGLITSYLILNLNEPSKLEDTSWIKPVKYIGIWWGMHIDKYTWGSGRRHGATTANAKRHIDFAAKHGFDGVLIEGWNVDWDGDWTENGEIFNFTQPHPDFDIDEVARYAQEKNVEIIGHHETGAAIDNYERQVEEAFRYYKKYGIDMIKTGYVGERANDTEWHHGQYMVRHYREVVKLAAKYQIALDVHEPIKDTGIRRSWPNMMTREGARGQEYNAWSPDGGNPPDHTTILPFTRMLSGPFDFTPGIFDLLLEKGNRPPNNRVNTTLAKQLALYVVIYSPMQMAADLPENYAGHPAFQFILDVPVDWDETRVLNGKIGDYVTFARKDRHSGDWYLGSITDENGRSLKTTLTFLEPDKQYVAEIYADAEGADWQSNPLAIDIREQPVDHTTTLTLKLAPGGGQVIRIREEEKP